MHTKKVALYKLQISIPLIVPVPFVPGSFTLKLVTLALVNLEDGAVGAGALAADDAAGLPPRHALSSAGPRPSRS
jgi:hypothetical protein